MPKITIVGLGPWQGGGVTAQAADRMTATPTVFRTARHPEVERANALDPVFLDALYERAEEFEELHRLLATEVLRLAATHGEVVYAVPGQGMAGDGSVRELLALAGEDCAIELLPGVDEAAPFLLHCARLGQDVTGAYAAVPAPMLTRPMVCRTMPLLLTQLDSGLTAGDCKLLLTQLYGDEAPVVFGDGQSARPIELWELDRQPRYDHRTMAWLPPAGQGARRDVADLMDILARLRAPGGCPWDREQTHESLKPCLLEEAYEVLEAIDHGDMEELSEELGDVLLQVVFHAQMAAERGDFDLLDVTDGICRKMIRRHPHVFGDVRANTADEVVTNWDAIKRQEKGTNTEAGRMADLPKAMPSVLRSMKIQGRAARVGFDWPDAEGAFDKLREEVDELHRAMAGGEGTERLSDELGDVLFAAINVARFLGVHPEFALAGTAEKFIRRFAFVEEQAAREGKTLQSMTLEQMDELWNRAKGLEKQE